MIHIFEVEHVSIFPVLIIHLFPTINSQSWDKIIEILKKKEVDTVRMI